MPYITSIERIGIKIGRKKGRMEGTLCTLREGILEILEMRHEALPKRLRENIGVMDNREQLKKLLRRAVTVQSLADFERDMFR